MKYAVWFGCGLLAWVIQAVMIKIQNPEDNFTTRMENESAHGAIGDLFCVVMCGPIFLFLYLLFGFALVLKGVGKLLDKAGI